MSSLFVGCVDARPYEGYDADDFEASDVDDFPSTRSGCVADDFFVQSEEQEQCYA